jgi:hypothetical protein
VFFAWVLTFCVAPSKCNFCAKGLRRISVFRLSPNFLCHVIKMKILASVVERKQRVLSRLAEDFFIDDKES